MHPISLIFQPLLLLNADKKYYGVVPVAYMPKQSGHTCLTVLQKEII